nr:unnamed protein product [Callosobruchus chinensis]
MFKRVAVTETWLTPNYSSSVVDIPGYIFHRLDRDGRGGGVGFYIRSSFKSQVMTVNRVIVLQLKCFGLKYSLVEKVLFVETISDHLAVYCNISFIFPKQTPRIVTFRNFKNFDQEQFTADLFSINWIDVIYIQNLDDKAKFISDNIIALFDHHAPLKTIRVTKPRAPWLTPNLKLLMKLRDKALHRFRKNPSPANRTHYNELRNFVVSATVAEKRCYILHLSQNVEPTGFFKTLKSLKVQESNLTDLPDCLSDLTEINNFFTNVFQNSDASCFEKTEFYSNSRLNENINFQLKLIDMATLLKIIRGIKSNACGSDGITIEMVRLCLPAIAPYVLHLINSCLEIGYFPQLWKEALILPLPKIPAPRTPSDLRPISILPVLSKGSQCI